MTGLGQDATVILMKSFGEFVGEVTARIIGELRREQNLSMEELAQRAGLHRTYIGLLERAERQPTIAAAADIAKALGTNLSDLIRRAEGYVADIGIANPTDIAAPDIEVLRSPEPRVARWHGFRSDALLTQLTGLDRDVIAVAMESAYHQLDLMDEQLIQTGSSPIVEIFELANVSSMIGNLLGSALARASRGQYARNRPHTYPDLVPQLESLPNLEVKMALETNMPKGHLAKAGVYLTFRYVLVDRFGTFTYGKNNRGSVAEIWEVRCGELNVPDFSISNTEGDSGKTAVIRSTAFNRMEVVYEVPELSPYRRQRKMSPPP